MESRTADLEIVSRLRSARVSVVQLAATGNLDVLDTVQAGSPESQVYVVKLLDVHPNLGKVSGRRLMASLGIPPFARLGELTESHKESIKRAVEGSRG